MPAPVTSSAARERADVAHGALDGALRSVSVFRQSRSWERPSDHVPVTATYEL